MSTGLAELVRIASAELDSANLTDDGTGLSAVISATLTRMLSNATLTADLMQHDIARRTVVPSAREQATPLPPFVRQSFDCYQLPIWIPH